MNIDFEKYADSLVPAVVQDARTQSVLMLGFMNREALELTRTTGRVTFFSRSRQRIWTKGETSGNFLAVREIAADCDRDTILIKADPQGPVCHTGADTCFAEENPPSPAGSGDDEDFLFALEALIRSRRGQPPENSYTAKLFAKGLNKIAQKVGEEAVELVIEAKDDDDELFKAEAADLLYHLLVLLAAKNVSLGEVLQVLKNRRK